jgi:hypothetical protein
MAWQILVSLKGVGLESDGCLQPTLGIPRFPSEGEGRRMAVGRLWVWNIPIVIVKWY